MQQFTLFVLLFLGNFQLVFAQDYCQRSHCNWEFFALKETVKGEVISHEFLPQKFSCRGLNYNRLIKNINDSYCVYSFCPSESCLSITILKINQDTICVLSYNDKWYNEGYSFTLAQVK